MGIPGDKLAELFEEVRPVDSQLSMAPLLVNVWVIMSYTYISIYIYMYWGPECWPDAPQSMVSCPHVIRNPVLRDPGINFCFRSSI